MAHHFYLDHEMADTGASRSINTPEDLPVYSLNPEYESRPHPETLTRRVVRDHEKRVKKDLKEAQKAEVQCARIKMILPEIHAQLSAACAAPRTGRQRSGPAALRQRDEEDEEGIEIVFKSRSIDQKALRRYLPLLLAEYQRQLETEETTPTVPNISTTLSRSVSEPALLSDDLSESSQEEDSASRPNLLHSVTTSQVRRFDPDRMSVKAGYFEGYSQKIYFSKRFVNLWKKKASGKRENLASGIAMVLIGLKLGLPAFDLITFAAIDLPRLALQSVTGKQTLKLRD